MKQKVDIYLDNLKKWKKELTSLRNLIVDCGLTEEFKWVHPCYTHKGKNILLIHEFKDYCAILFHKGALLNDSKKILAQQTENTQAARQIRFKNISEIEMLKELAQKFEENPNFENAFKSLTEGRQKGYLLHFSQPKQSKTRLLRIEKNMDRIFNGNGLNDCVCGLSKRLPNCDGSHKQLEK